LLCSIAYTFGAVVLLSTWSWTSSNILVDVKSDSSHNVVSIKDPTIVQYQGHYHVFASIVDQNGYSMVYLNFSDFNSANSAPWYYMDRTAGFGGYKCAPELFYFQPHNLWYLVFQSPWPTYSTNSDPGNVHGWSTPKTYFTNMPNNAIDFFTICDDANCYLFFSNDGGVWYRTSTSKSSFPSGWGGFTQVLKSSNQYTYFEASWVYKLTTQNEYFAGIEGIGSDGNRYYQTFTAPSLGGQWTELAPGFATHSDVKWPVNWSSGISHGELVRAGYNELIELNPCGIQFLFQGVSPDAHNPYDQLPWKLGLLTSTTNIQGC